MPSFPAVVVIGSIMQDLTFACAEFPARGQTVVGRLHVGQGGKGSNQAIACGRAGARTIFIGALGQGAFAGQVRTFYRKARIGCRLALKSGCPTGTAVILLNQEGQNQIVIEPGANARLVMADIPRRLLTNAKVVVTQLESNQATTARVLRAARQAGVTTLLNPAPMPTDFNPGLLSDVDILVPNETEFAALVRHLPQIRQRRFRESDLQEMPAAQFQALCQKFRVPTVIVTLGKRGCFISGQAGWRMIPAHTGMKVVDTTGAGDAFCGGLAAGLVRYAGDMVAAARLGTAVAALSITKPGAANAMPTEAELNRFYPAGVIR